jgi:hypothetical protein
MSSLQSVSNFLLGLSSARDSRANCEKVNVGHAKHPMITLRHE